MNKLNSNLINNETNQNKTSKEFIQLKLKEEAENNKDNSTSPIKIKNPNLIIQKMPSLASIPNNPIFRSSNYNNYTNTKSYFNKKIEFAEINESKNLNNSNLKNDRNFRSVAISLDKLQDKNILTNLTLNNSINNNNNNNLNSNTNNTNKNSNINLENSKRKNFDLLQLKKNKNFTHNNFYISNVHVVKNFKELKYLNKNKENNYDLENLNLHKISERDYNDGFSSNRNTKPDNALFKLDINSPNKKNTENSQNSNSGLKIPKNFLRFNSDIFAENYNNNYFNNNFFNRKSREASKNNSNNHFLK